MNRSVDGADGAVGRLIHTIIDPAFLIVSILGIRVPSTCLVDRGRRNRTISNPGQVPPLVEAIPRRNLGNESSLESGVEQRLMNQQDLGVAHLAGQSPFHAQRPPRGKRIRGWERSHGVVPVLGIYKEHYLGNQASASKQASKDYAGSGLSG